MIKDKLSGLLSNSINSKRVTVSSPKVGAGERPFNDNTASGVTLSREATGGEESSSRVGDLLGGLESWGAPDSETSERAGQAGQAAGGWNDVLKLGQMPMSVIRQVFSTMNNAGGMATAGALHSLLSWGVAERKKTGQIREEFQSILREAIDFAKKNKNMSEEDLAKYESKLFGGGQEGGAGKRGAGKKGSLPKFKSVPRVSDILRKKLGLGN